MFIKIAILDTLHFSKYENKFIYNGITLIVINTDNITSIIKSKFCNSLMLNVYILKLSSNLIYHIFLSEYLFIIDKVRLYSND